MKSFIRTEPGLPGLDKGWVQKMAQRWQILVCHSKKDVVAEDVLGL